ncbi:MAG TPA: PAS domain-containing protein, partial [Terriglobales bacterium]
MAPDITERKRAEEALRASEERLRLAQQAARIGTFEWNIQTGVNTWTPELEEMYGLPRGGFGGTQTAFENLVYSDDRAGVIELNNWALKTGLPTQGEWRVVWPDGSVHWIAGRWQVFMNDSGEPSRMVGINIDITDRKRVEQELSEANERLRLALEAGSAGGWDYDLKAGKNVWFGTAHEQLGMTPDETSGSRKEFWDRIHEDDRERMEHALQVAKEKHEVYAEDVRVVWRDGTTRWLRSRGRFQYDANGEAERSLGISLDITENKQAEQALRASEERLRLAQQAARIGTFERDVRTGRITWAEGLEPLYGLSPGSLDGKTPEFFKDLIHPTDMHRAAQLIQEALKTGQPTEGEWRAIWPDGSVHWIASRWQVLMDDSGEPSRVVGVNMDVTERKLAELALHAREELLEIFVKNVPAPVAMLDRDMRYVQVSDRWCGDYLAGRAQVLGRSHYELFPDMPERWKEAHRRALAGETLRADEDHWDAQDGPHWARWEVRPWKTPEGIVGGILILAEDITRRKQMEEMLSRMSRKLIEAQEQERARIGRELHDDINQRVAILAIEIERLERRPRVPSEIRKTAHEISGRIKELCTDIQALSQELHSSKLEYRGIVGGMKSWCREFGERQGMQIEFKHSGSLRSLPSQTSVCLFRVLQEALH